MRSKILIGLMALSLTAMAQSSRGVTKLGQLSYNQNLNDVWGWHDGNGNEWALVGTTTGLSVVNVTNPANPQEALFLPGAGSTWRDIKTFGNYAYVVHDGTNDPPDGLFILDMTSISQTFPNTWTRNPDIPYEGSTQTLETAHNIYIDENGILYAFGSNVGEGGALMFDLKPDPSNPTYLGMFDDYYLHDGVVRGDTMWGAAVYQGFFSAINVNNKQNPSVYGVQGTPLSFTHNIWFSDDNQRVFTTDERGSAFIAEYDVSDLTNISEQDRIRSSLNSTAMPHNAHFFNDFLVNSYYSSGLQIVDVSVPGNMVETAYYDTSPNSSSSSSSGAWGAYPWLPSGNILVTDIQNGLFTLSSDYPRAARVSVSVKDSVTGQNIPGANVTLLFSPIGGRTDVFGLFKGGQADTGTFTAVTTKANYQPDTTMVSLHAGQVTNLAVELIPEGLSLNEARSIGVVQLFPNPSRGTVELSQIKPEIQNLQYHLLSMGGRELQGGALAVNEGRAKVNLEGTPPGMYLLRLTGPKGNQVARKITLR